MSRVDVTRVVPIVSGNLKRGVEDGRRTVDGACEKVMCDETGIPVRRTQIDEMMEISGGTDANTTVEFPPTSRVEV